MNILLLPVLALVALATSCVRRQSNHQPLTHAVRRKECTLRTAQSEVPSVTISSSSSFSGLFSMNIPIRIHFGQAIPPHYACHATVPTDAEFWQPARAITWDDVRKHVPSSHAIVSTTNPVFPGFSPDKVWLIAARCI